jgi:hypothetical protein
VLKAVMMLNKDALSEKKSKETGIASNTGLKVGKLGKKEGVI